MPALSHKVTLWGLATAVAAADGRLLLLSTLIVIVLFMGSVVWPAVWSRNQSRRQAARKVLQMITLSAIPVGTGVRRRPRRPADDEECSKE